MKQPAVCDCVLSLRAAMCLCREAGTVKDSKWPKKCWGKGTVRRRELLSHTTGRHEFRKWQIPIVAFLFASSETVAVAGCRHMVRNTLVHQEVRRGHQKQHHCARLCSVCAYKMSLFDQIRLTSRVRQLAKALTKCR